MKKILLLSILLISLPASALEYRILAVVNGQSISTVQLRDRVGLIMSSTGMENNAANKNKVTKEVVEILINEILQAQEAKERGIEVTDAEMKAVIVDLEKRNKVKPGGLKDFIKSKKQSYDAVIEQIKTSLTWQKFLARVVRPQVQLTEQDIKDEAAKPLPKAAPDDVQVSISEIVVPIEFGKEAEAKDLADTIVRTARSGGKKFSELAEKYSVGKSAKNGGKLGWIPEKAVVEPLATAIKNTKEGGVSNAVKAQSMYVILKVNERKVIKHEDTSQGRTPEERALMSKIEAEAKKYIKAMRDRAYIERKYKDEDLAKFVWG